MGSDLDWEATPFPRRLHRSLTGLPNTRESIAPVGYNTEFHVSLRLIG